MTETDHSNSRRQPHLLTPSPKRQQHAPKYDRRPLNRARFRLAAARRALAAAIPEVPADTQARADLGAVLRELESIEVPR